MVSIGQFFRTRNNNAAVWREHYQLNCDIMAESDFCADIELIALCINILRGFGLTKKICRSNQRPRVLDRLFTATEIADRALEEVLQTIDKSGRESREKTEEKLGKTRRTGVFNFDKGGRSGKLDRLVDGLGARGLAGFVDVDVRIVRGLAYYTARFRSVRSRGKIARDRRWWAATTI